MVKRYTEAGVVQIGPPGKWIPETDYDALAAQLAIYKGREEAKQLVINQLEAALRKYGDHTIACVLETRGDPCNCGWTKALLSNFARETGANQATHHWCPSKVVWAHGPEEKCADCEKEKNRRPLGEK